MNDLYLTSTFTNPWNVEFNSKIGDFLEKNKMKCYLPHRDTNQSGNKDTIFTGDIGGIDNSNLILAIAMNESPNFGAEVGYAYAKNTPIIALTTKNHHIPLICEKMCVEIIQVDDIDNIQEYIELLIEKINTHKRK